MNWFGEGCAGSRELVTKDVRKPTLQNILSLMDFINAAPATAATAIATASAGGGAAAANSNLTPNPKQLRQMVTCMDLKPHAIGENLNLSLYL